ncbi:tetratricopeptide repeat protein [Aquiflexum sp.]|uniref:tetratricopeptide repeat protein n=1 Tax=Aquiflexum sp. TaxID=1872584 RepID=UPI00359369BC
MDLNQKDIRLVLADIYKNACLDEDCDMRELAIVLENLAEVYENYPTIQAWSKVKIDKERFEKKAYYQRILELRSGINNKLLEKAIGNIENQAAKDRDLAFTQWLIIYTEALVNWEGEIFGNLCKYKFDFNPKDKDKIEELKSLNQLVLDSKWPEIYPYFLNFAENEKLPVTTRSYFYLYSAQIVLYYFGYSDIVENLIQKSEEVFPDNKLINRVKGELLIIENNLDKARTLLLNAINVDPNHIENYNYLGDSYLNEQKFETAEQWYNDAVQINFLEYLPYSKLINLMGEPVFFETRPGEIQKLLEKACSFLENEEFGNKLYILHMDAGNGFKKAKNYEKSIEYYLKAIELKPDFSSGKIDLAYVYADKSDFEEAEKWLKAAVYPKKESLNFAAYWALGWLNESDQLNNIPKSIEYYQKCLGIRTMGDDRVYNMLGILYYNLGENEKSAEYYRKAINEYKYEIVYHTNLKSALEKIGGNELMVDFYDNLVASFPHKAEYFNEAGVFHYNIEDYSRALDYYDKAITLVPDNRIFWENRGLVQEKINNYDFAISDYLRSLEFQEDDFLYNAVGRLKYWQEKNEEAVIYYSKAIELNPDYAMYWENRAYANEKLENLRPAENDIQHALSLEETPARFNLLGLIYFKLNDFQSALEYFTKAENDEPTNRVYIENRASAYRNLELYDEAIQEYQRSIEIKESDFSFNAIGVMKYLQGKFMEAIDFYSKALQLDGNNPIYWENRALAYEKAGNYEFAEMDSKKALEIEDSSGRNNILGLSLHKQGKIDEAIVYYSKALELDANNPIYWENRALAYENSKNYSLAELDSKKALEIEGSPLRYNLLGLSLYMQGKNKEAIQYYTQAIEMDHFNPVFWENRALAFEAMGLYQDALADYSEVIEIKEDPITYNSIGKLNYWTKNFHEAIENYSKAIELDGSKAILYENRGLAYYALQDFTSAEQDFLKSLSIAESKIVFNQLGIIEMEQSQFEKAVEYFSKAIIISQNEAILWENRAQAKESLGWNKEAFLDYQKALSLGPSPVSLNGLGKLSYKESDFEKACEYFAKAVESDPTNEVYKNNLELAKENKGS